MNPKEETTTTTATATTAQLPLQLKSLRHFNNYNWKSRQPLQLPLQAEEPTTTTSTTYNWRTYNDFNYHYNWKSRQPFNYYNWKSLHDHFNNTAEEPATTSTIQLKNLRLLQLPLQLKADSDFTLPLFRNRQRPATATTEGPNNHFCILQQLKADNSGAPNLNNWE